MQIGISHFTENPRDDDRRLFSEYGENRITKIVIHITWLYPIKPLIHSPILFDGNLWIGNNGIYNTFNQCS